MEVGAGGPGAQVWDQGQGKGLGEGWNHNRGRVVRGG